MTGWNESGGVAVLDAPPHGRTRSVEQRPFIEAIRQEIAAGIYDTPERMDVALDLMIDMQVAWFLDRGPRRS